LTFPHGEVDFLQAHALTPPRTPQSPGHLIAGLLDRNLNARRIQRNAVYRKDPLHIHRSKATEYVRKRPSGSCIFFPVYVGASGGCPSDQRTLQIAAGLILHNSNKDELLIHRKVRGLKEVIPVRVTVERRDHTAYKHQYPENMTSHAGHSSWGFAETDRLIHSRKPR
jgi:hypothetical protein